MVKVISDGQMEVSFKETSKTITLRALAFTNGMMGECLMDPGL